MRRYGSIGMGLLAALLLGGSAQALFHLWETEEVFSSPDGTIQFVRMTTTFDFQDLMSGHALKTTGACFIFPSDLSTNLTAGESMLLATVGFAALPGAPAPDYTIPDNFINVAGDTIELMTTCTLEVWDTFSYGAGQLPTDGLTSLTDGGSTGSATPVNFNGQGFLPPGASELLVEKLPANRLGLTWQACLGGVDHHIVHGIDTNLGGVYTLSGSATCNIGGSPFIWTTVPPDPPSGRFRWFLVLADDDQATEGSWGQDSSGSERDGVGAGGSSMTCAITGKDLTNSCGQ